MATGLDLPDRNRESFHDPGYDSGGNKSSSQHRLVSRFTLNPVVRHMSAYRVAGKAFSHRTRLGLSACSIVDGNDFSLLTALKVRESFQSERRVRLQQLYHTRNSSRGGLLHGSRLEVMLLSACFFSTVVHNSCAVG